MSLKRHELPRIFAALLALALLLVLLPPCALADTHETVRVGWFLQPGYQGLDSDGNPSGYNYEFLMKMAEKNGWELEFVTENTNGTEMTWGDSLSMLENGQLDLMGCLLYSEERAEVYDFSTLSAGQIFTSLFVRGDSPLGSNDLTALNGIRVAANLDTLNDEDLMEYEADMGFAIGGFTNYTDIQGVIDAVLSGAADAGVLASYQPTEDTRIIASFSPRPFYFATTKGNTGVLTALNQAMNAILVQDPYYSQTLSNKYRQTYSGQATFTPEEQALISAAEPVRVCYSDAWFPLIQSSPNSDTPTGVVPDILSRVSESTGLQFEYLHVDSHAAALEAAGQGEYDMLAVCVYDLLHARDYKMGMTDSYLSMQLVMVSRSQVGAEEMTVGTLADFPLFNTAVKGEDATDYHYYTTSLDCFEALRQGEVDAIVVSAYTANYYLALSRYSRFLRTNLQGQSIPVCMAVSDASPDQTLLLSILNKAISNLSATDINRIMLDNTVRDSSGFEAAVNRIPTTVVIVAFLVLVGLSILIVLLSAALVRRSKLARRHAEQDKAAAEQAAELLRMDALTGLYNESGFDAAARQSLDANPQRHWFLMDFDVDGFKYVNALYGKTQADRLLVALTHIVEKDLRPGELCGRIYGDHFVALISGENLAEIKARISQCNEKFRQIADRYIIIMSYGIYPVEDLSAQINTMRDRAQVAKRKVKGNNKEFIAVYDDALDQRQKDELELVLSVDRAIADGEFQAWFQPQYDMKTEKIVSAEALVRWRHGDELIMPDRFISLFESNGLIEKLDFCVVEAVCAHLRAQLAAGLTPVPVAVNFSKSHLYDQTFLPRLKELIENSGAPAELLVAEFTEYTCLENKSTFCETIHQLHQIGMRVSLDDFGSGYSSLNMLSEMEFDEIKLDKGFLKDSPLSDKEEKLIRAILQLLQGLKIQTVAEGVETEEQLAFLRESGCDIAQGYYFSRPVSGENYDNLLRQTRESKS